MCVGALVKEGGWQLTSFLSIYSPRTRSCPGDTPSVTVPEELKMQCVLQPALLNSCSGSWRPLLTSGNLSPLAVGTSSIPGPLPHSLSFPYSLLPWFPWLHLPLQGGRSQGLSRAAPAPHPPSPRPLLAPVAAAPAHVSMPLSSTPLVPTIPGPQVHESRSVLTPQHHKLDQTYGATLPHVAIPFLYRQLLNLETSPWLITLSVAEIAPKSISCISVPNYPSLGQFL